ncbi:MAG: MgtC/SapB family protein [Bacilli bacterium]|nr:MgtC/SapB family protein [Bacilli bacterium]
MTTLDNIITNWFNAGFGGAVSPWVGNIVLISVSLLLTVLFAFVIGFEREYQGHAAGLRTHLLVAIGSALIMIISLYGFDPTKYPSRDPARLAAQVVSGIGFLGAGTIVQTGTDVKGLTTATTLWISMAIGLCFGSGNFVIGVIGTIFAFLALVSMKKFEKVIQRKNPIVTIVVPSDKPVMKEIVQISQRYGLTLRETYTELVSFEENSALRIEIRITSPSHQVLSNFVDEVRFTIRPLELKVTAESQN